VSCGTAISPNAEAKQKYKDIVGNRYNQLALH
jgi:hypothetical protein